MSDDIVKFLMPDGSKVSNDLRFRPEDEEYNAPNWGHAGVPDELQQAQSGVRAASLQSGQEGVGQNATLGDQPLTDAQQLQRDVSFSDPDVVTGELVDSNEAVAEAQERMVERQEEAAKAATKLAQAGETPGDPDLEYAKWTPKQLKAEALRRNAERDDEHQLELKGIKKKQELIDVLERDDDENPSDQGDGDQS